MAERDNKGIEDLTGQKPQAPNTSTPAENTTGSEGAGADSPTRPPAGGRQTPTRPGVDIAGVPGTKSPVTSDRTPTPRGGAKDVAGRPGPSLPGRTNAAKPRGGAGQNTGAPIDDMLADLQNEPGGFDRNRVGRPLREEDTPREEDAPEESPDDDNRELDQGDEDETEQPDGEDFSEESEAGRAAEGAEAEEAAAGAEAAEGAAVMGEAAEGAALAGEVAEGGAALAALPEIGVGCLVVAIILLMLLFFFSIVGVAGGGSHKSGGGTAINQPNGGEVTEAGPALIKAFTEQDNIVYQNPGARADIEAGDVKEDVLRAVLSVARTSGIGTLDISAAACRSHHEEGIHCPNGLALDIGDARTTHPEKVNKLLCASVKDGNPYHISDLWGIVTPGCTVNGGRPGNGSNPDYNGGNPTHVHVDVDRS